MKVRHALCFLALVLCCGAFAAGAAPAEKAEAPALVAAEAAPLAQSAPAGACDVKAAKSGADTKLQIAFAPSLSWLSATSQGLGGGKCGTCGDSICSGQAVGALCGFDGVNWYACIDLYGNACPASGGRRQCTCTTSGPL